MRSRSFISCLAVCCLAGVCGVTLRGADDFDRLLQQGRAAYAAADVNTASRFYEKACGAEAIKDYAPERAARCHHHLAIVSAARGEQAGAERHYLQAIEFWKSAGTQYAASLSETLMNLGDLYLCQHRPGDAEGTLQQAVSFARQVEKERPELVPEALSLLAVTYRETNRLEPALSTLKDALQRFAVLKTAVPSEEAYAWNGLGMVQLGSGIETEGEASVRRAISLSTSSLGEDHPDTALYQTNLALVLIARGEFDRAATLLRRAKMVLETHSGASDARLGLILAELSACALGDNKLTLAEQYSQQALSILNRQPETDGTAIAFTGLTLADVYMRAHRVKDAEAVLTPAIATVRRLVPDSRLLADGLRRFADLRAQQHAWQAAQDLYREAIEIYERQLGANHPALAPALWGYADALRHFGGSKAEVRVLESRAKAVSGLTPRS